MDILLREIEHYCLISIDTPLLANLNMIENIALIPEVHKHISVQKAQELAQNCLAKIEKEDISLKRMHQLNEVEIFYVLIARALMDARQTIVIVNPLSILKHVEFLAIAMKNLAILNEEKNIIILENDINRFHYEGMWVFNGIQ